MGDHQNILDLSARADPYPIYASARRDQPVLRVASSGLWVVVRYRDVKAALMDHETFSSRGFKYLLNPPWLPDSPQGDSLLAADPPEHTRLRSLVNKAFTPRTINELTDRMNTAARDIIGAFGDKAEIELMEDFNFPYISQIIGSIVGFEASMHGQIKRWVDGMNYLGPEAPQEPVLSDLSTMQERINHYSLEVIRERRAQAREDLISRIIHAEVDGQRLTERECQAMLQLLIGAGFDTTNVLLSNCLRQLSAEPALLDSLHRAPELIPNFIDEVMRYDPPTHGLLRQTTRDVEVAGVTIPRDAFVMLMLGSAARDGDHYSDPDSFDLHRKDRDSLSFGHGPHVCVGMMLARMEVRIALEHFIGNYRAVSCPGPHALQWSPAATSRSVVSLPLRLTPR